MKIKDCNAYIYNILNEREFIYKDTVLVNLSMKYFNIKSNIALTEKNVNNSINQNVNGFYNYVQNYMVKEAFETYKTAMENDFPFNTNQAYLVYNLTLNSNCYLSYYIDKYEFTGGAHGNTIRSSETFNLCTGKKIPLCAYFTPETDYKKVLIKLIQMQADENITENPYIYFDNYRELIEQNFNENSYFLTDKSISIYYQQYEIAPYSTGIVVFDIPYSVTACPPSC